jgi:hypothetical protein
VRAAEVGDLAEAAQQQLKALQSRKGYDHEFCRALFRRWMTEDPEGCAAWIGGMESPGIGWWVPFGALLESLENIGRSLDFEILASAEPWERRGCWQSMALAVNATGHARSILDWLAWVPGREGVEVFATQAAGNAMAYDLWPELRDTIARLDETRRRWAPRRPRKPSAASPIPKRKPRPVGSFSENDGPCGNPIPGRRRHFFFGEPSGLAKAMSFDYVADVKGEATALREPVKKRVGGSLGRRSPLERLEMLRRNARMLRGGTWSPPKDDGTVVRKVVGASR